MAKVGKNQAKEEAMSATAESGPLKAAGDYKALDQLPQECFTRRLKSLPVRPPQRYEAFRIPGVVFDMALSGKIPGVRKANW
jgi:small subunit ribosomal protein S14